MSNFDFLQSFAAETERPCDQEQNQYDVRDRIHPLTADVIRREVLRRCEQ